MEPEERRGVEPEGAERIAKAMARAGLCSRRDAERLIAQGRVSVNGETVASPARNVGSQDRIVVDGKPLPARERTRLFLYNKPRGLVTTHADPDKRATIFQALPPGLPRLVSVGRLDLNTEGLLLLTNDGGLARVLELPSTGWLRRYRVRAHGSVTQAVLDELRAGVNVDGVRYGPIEAALERTQGANVWLTFAIREGKNREVRNVLGALGLEVNRLIRVSFGPFQLGEIAAGETQEVRTRTLREQLGERIVRQAGLDFSAPSSRGGATQSPSAPAQVRNEPMSEPATPRVRQRRGAAGRQQRPGKPQPPGRQGRAERVATHDQKQANRGGTRTKQVSEKCHAVFRQKPATKQEPKQAKRCLANASLLRENSKTGRQGSRPAERPRRPGAGKRRK